MLYVFVEQELLTKAYPSSLIIFTHFGVFNDRGGDMRELARLGFLKDIFIQDGLPGGWGMVMHAK